MKLSKLSSNPVPIIVSLLEMIDKNNEREYPPIDTVSLKTKKERKEQAKSKNSKSSNDKKTKDFSIIEVNVGKIDSIRPNQLVVYFHDELKVHREHFGKIVIEEKKSYVEVKTEALRFFKNIKNKKINGKTLQVNVLGKNPR